MSDLGDALIILGLAAREMFLNNSMWLIKSMIFLLEILFLFNHKYRIPVILR